MLARLMEIRERETAASGDMALQVSTMSKSMSASLSNPLAKHKVALGCIFDRISAFCFITYIAYTGGDLVAMIPLFVLLDNLNCITTDLYESVIKIINASAGQKSIESFLLAEEVSGVAKDTTTSDSTSSILVEMDAAEFAWPTRYTAVVKQAEEHRLLQDENHALRGFQVGPIEKLVFRPRELIAVFGAVGSGKSSLLAAIVSDMPRIAGSMVTHVEPAHCSQTPWIQNASIRDNIIFGLDFEEQRYRTVVAACGLLIDLAELGGDATILGELGINISGGQKTRIILARTLYQDRPLILLDDPLSTLDATTMGHVFKHAIQPACQKDHKCVVLVTHQRHLLPHCDRIVWMDSGRVRRTGTYQDLLADPEFSLALGEENNRKQASEERSTDESGEGAKLTFADPINGDGMVIEERASEEVPLSTYTAFAGLCAKPTVTMLLIVSIMLSQVANGLTPLMVSSNPSH